MLHVSTRRLLAALAAASATTAVLVALPGIATGDAAAIRTLLGLGAVLPLAIVLPIAAVVVPLYLLLRRPRHEPATTRSPGRSAVAAPQKSPGMRILASLIGGVVGTLVAVAAASNGHIAAISVPILAVCGAVLGYADACWREPPQTSEL